MRPFDPFTLDIRPGSTLVEASAGTGKTYAITQLVLRLVLDPEARHLIPEGEDLPDLRRLLVVTFTKAATEELKTRIRRALRETLDAYETPAAPASDLGESFRSRYGATPADRAEGVRRLRRALGDVGEAAVFTIHGFCKRVLERSAFESGEPFAFDFVEDAGQLKKRAARDVWHSLMTAHPGLGALAFSAGWSLDRLLDHHGAATRYESTEIRPSAQPLADALAHLGEAVDHLAAVWDADAALAVFEGASLKKSAGDLGHDARRVFERVAAFARGEWRHLDAVRASTAEKAAEAVSYANREPGKSVVASVLEHPLFAACQRVGDAADAVEHALVHAFVAGTDAAFRRLKQSAGLFDADDLIARLRDALAHPSTGPALAAAMRAQIAVALVDEFQDTDPRQYDVFRLGLGARDGSPGRPLFFIGDPKQAIYAFRGADVFAYLRAKHDTEPDRRFTLAQNHRSSPALVAAVNALFERGGERPFVYDGIPFESVTAASETPGIRGVEPAAPFVWWTAEDLDLWQGVVSKDPARQAALEATVAEIVALLTNAEAEIWHARSQAWRAVRPSDLAVLVRTNPQARDVQDALRDAGVPAVIARGADIRESPTFDAVERILRAVARPSESRAVRAALATSLLGWSAHRLAEVDEAEVGRVVEAFRSYRQVWRRQGVFNALTAIADGEGVWAEIRRYGDAERRVTNLRHVMELLHHAERAADRGVDEMLVWIRTRMDHTFSEASRVEMRLESDARAVQVVTMHNSKGLEYPVVFAPYLWDAKDQEQWPGGGFVEKPPLAHVEDGGAVYDLSEADDVRALAEAERLAEHLRLTYVALTRARERVYTMWGPLSGGHMSGLGALLGNVEVPERGALAAMDEGTKARAKDALKEGVARLGWIRQAGLDQPRPDQPDARPPMAVVPLPHPAGRYQRPDEARELGAARPVTSSLARQARDHAVRASFSGWASGAPHDAHADDPAPARDRDAEEAGLFAFAAGPHAGTCFHELLEHADLGDPAAYAPPSDPAHETRQRRAVRRVLERHGLLAASAHRAEIEPVGVVCDMLHRLAQAEVPGLGVTVGALGAGATEWSFVAPLGHATPGRIADVFEAHGDDALRDYAASLRRLRADQARGLFVGTADAIANAGTPEAPRWLVVDWKSNHLGPTAEHYGPDPLARAMRQHHYLLQAHLYLAGLHRHLSVRLGERYDYDRDVGGAAYVFLRGLGAETSGIHVSRPSRALVDALDAVLFAPIHA